jgi:hypothetical protein
MDLLKVKEQRASQVNAGKEGFGGRQNPILLLENPDYRISTALTPDLEKPFATLIHKLSSQAAGIVEPCRIKTGVTCSEGIFELKIGEKPVV